MPNVLPLLDPLLAPAPKSGVPAPTKGRITAIRIENDPTAGVSFRVDREDRVDAEIWENGQATAKTALGSVRIPVGAKETISVAADTQGLVMISRSGWYPDCEPPIFLALGTFFPCDESDASGTQLPNGRRLFWSSNGTVSPPVKQIDFTVTGSAKIAWRHLGLSGEFDLGTALGRTKSVHIALLTRNGETGMIGAPAFGLDNQLRLV